MESDENFMSVTWNLTSENLFTFRADLHVDLNTFLVQIGIVLPSPSGKFDKSITNSVLDICKHFKNTAGNMFLRLIFNNENFGNDKKFLPTNCPIKPGNYFIENFSLEENFPTIRGVESKFLALVDFCTKVNGKLVCFAKTKFYGEMRDRKKWEREMEQKKRNSKISG